MAASAAREDRYGFAESESARSGDVPDSAREHHRTATSVHLSDCTILRTSIGFAGEGYTPMCTLEFTDISRSTSGTSNSLEYFRRSKLV